MGASMSGQHGAQVDLQDSTKMSALVLAKENGRTKLVEILESHVKAASGNPYQIQPSHLQSQRKIRRAIKQTEAVQLSYSRHTPIAGYELGLLTGRYWKIIQHAAKMKEPVHQSFDYSNSSLPPRQEVGSFTHIKLPHFFQQACADPLPRSKSDVKMHGGQFPQIGPLKAQEKSHFERDITKSEYQQIKQQKQNVGSDPTMEEPTAIKLESGSSLQEQDFGYEWVQYGQQQSAGSPEGQVYGYKQLKHLQTLKHEPGECECGYEKEFQYYGEKICFDWTTRGFRLHVPEDALPPSINEILVTVKVTAAAGQDHIIPPETKLVSGVYTISTSHTFTKPVMLEIEYSCFLEFPGDAKGFAFGHCSRNIPPYDFHIVEGGDFLQSKFGRIYLDKFSIYAILQYLWSYFITRYCASLYYSLDWTNLHTWHVYLVITKDTEIAKQEVKRHFKDQDIQVWSNTLGQQVKFEDDHISLPIPSEGWEVQRGWRLEPQTTPIIFKSDVDSYVDGVIPCCHLYLSYSLRSSDTLKHRLSLDGASAPYNYILMSIRSSSWTTCAKSHCGIVTSRPPPRPSTALQVQQVCSNLKHFCTESNRSDLFRELLPLASEWKNIGTLLGIPDGDLDAIQQSNPHQPRDCVREMIKIWLRMIDPEPTWEGLVEALKYVNRQKAQDICSKYIAQ